MLANHAKMDGSLEYSDKSKSSGLHKCLSVA